jgi:hypothetical protein
MSDDLRAPNPYEMELFCWMLEHGKPEVRAFLPQLEGILVSTGCECGCPSLKLSVRPEHRPVLSPERIIVEAVSEMENSCIGLMLWTKDGKLADFEVWEAGIDERPYRLPAIDTLRITGN